ncbi:MAG: response regulator transcription factor [Pseudomonadota bacterium]|nr:response regulator transcription factor [Pseudomonadota bacterium]
MTTQTEVPTVFVIDDDPALRDSLQWLLESVGLKVATFARPRDFLAAYATDRPGCLLLDVRMPGMSGLHVQQTLREAGIALPVIIITAHGDVAMAVAAMKSGATDFIEKPFNDQLLLDCVQNALTQNQLQRQARARHQQVIDRFNSLTTRERQVMALVVEGLPNKTIADTLDVSRKTVEVHRSKVMDKMQAETLSDLIQMAMAVGLLKEYGGQESPPQQHRVPTDG